MSDRRVGRRRRPHRSAPEPGADVSDELDRFLSALSDGRPDPAERPDEAPYPSWGPPQQREFEPEPREIEPTQPEIESRHLESEPRHWESEPDPRGDPIGAEPPNGETAGRHRARRTGGTRLLVEVRVVGMVLRRELVKFWRGKARIASGFAQPLLFLLIFGFGIQSIVSRGSGVNFAGFVVPGVIAMNVLGRAFGGAVTVVNDGEQGFLREMLVAPASRVSIVVGAILGGATTATLQAMLLFIAAPVMGVWPSPLAVLGGIGAAFLLAVEITALGVAAATFVRTPQSFQALTQTVMYPMLVFSGSLFPLKGLPAFIQAVGKFNPMTYPVDALRRLLLEADSPGSPYRALTGVDVFGHTLSAWEEIVITVGVTLLCTAVAARGFGRVR